MEGDSAIVAMEDDSVIVAESEHFPGNLITSLQRLRCDGKFCDVTIKCADTELKAHKTVLASATEYFEAMFGNDTKEASTGIIDFSHLPTEVVKQCLDFVYSGNVEISVKTVKDMLNLTEMMQLNDLARLCVEFLAERISMENCCEMVVLSNLHCKESLSGKIGVFLAKNFKEFIETDDFKSLEYDCLSHCLDLLQDAVTGRVCEVRKWKGILSWIRYDMEQRKKWFFKLFRTINLSCLSKDDLKKALSQPLVKESSDCLELIAMHCVDDHDESCSAPKKKRLSQALYFHNESQLIIQYDVKSDEYLPPIAFPGTISEDVSVVFHNDCVYAGDGKKVYRLCEGKSEGFEVSYEWTHETCLAAFSGGGLSNSARAVNSSEDICFCRCVGIGNYVYMIASKYAYQFDTTTLQLRRHITQILLPNKFFITASDDQIFVMSENGNCQAYVLDVDTKKCSRIKNMLEGCHTGLALWYDERLFTFCYKRNEPACIVSVYDPIIDCWALVSDIEVVGVAKSFYISDKLYLTGKNHENICAEIDLEYLKSIEVKLESCRYVLKYD